MSDLHGHKRRDPEKWLPVGRQSRSSETPPPLQTILTSLSLGMAFLVLAGCGDKPNETVRGLQEENKVLRERIQTLEKEKADTENSGNKRVEVIRGDQQQRQKELEDSIVKLQEVHRTKVSQLESELASLHLELGATHREKIALQQALDASPRIEAGNNRSAFYGQIVLAIMLLLSVFFGLFFALRFWRTRDRLNHVVLTEVAQLRRIGAN